MRVQGGPTGMKLDDNVPFPNLRAWSCSISVWEIMSTPGHQTSSCSIAKISSDICRPAGPFRVPASIPHRLFVAQLSAYNRIADPRYNVVSHRIYPYLRIAYTCRYVYRTEIGIWPDLARIATPVVLRGAFLTYAGPEYRNLDV